MNLKKAVSFIKKEFEFSQGHDLHKLYRIYSLIAVFFSPLITFFLFGDNTVRHIVFDLSIPIAFFIILVASFLSEKVKINLKIIFFIVCFLASYYAYFNLYSSSYNTEDFIGFILAFFSISIGIQDHRYSVVYTLSTLVLILITGFIQPVGEISPVSIFILVLLVGIVCFVIHYNRYVLLLKLNESRNELEGSRDRLLTVLDSIDKVVYNVSVDEKGGKTLRYVSSKIEEVLGLSIEDYFTDVKAGRLIDRIHPDDLPGVIEQSRLLMSKKMPVAFVYRFKKHDDYVWIEEKVFPKIDEKGKHVASIGISSDVTLRINSEQALKKSEERYRNMIERNLAGFYRIDVENILVDCNDSFARILGFSNKKEIIGKPINNLYADSSDKNKFITLLKEHIHIRNHESLITLNTGKSVWLLENVSLVFNTFNQPDYIEGTAFDITELKNAQLNIQSVQDNLSLVINNIDSLVYSLDVAPDGKKEFNFLGPQIETLIGVPREQYIEEVKSGKINEYFHPDDLKKVGEELKILKENKSHGTFKYRFWSHKTNDYIWLEENMFPQYNSEGNIYKNFGVVRDISATARYEDALRKSEVSYRTLFEQNLAGVFRTTVNGKILDCNDAFVRIYGYDSREEIMQISSKEFYFTEQDRLNYLNDLKQYKILTNYELCLKRKDGSKVWVLANVSLHSNADDSTDEVLMGTLIDITELKLTSEALLENEQKFRLLFEVANDAILLLHNGKIMDCNDRAVELFGCEKAEFIGNELITFSPDFQPDGIPSTEKLAQKFKSVEEGNSQFFYWRNSKKDQTNFDSEISLNSFYIGERIYVQVIIRDITQRMKAEMALRESEERFKLLANSTIEGIVFSENGKIVDCNEQYALLHGFSARREVIGKNILDFVYPEYHAILSERMLANHDDPIEVRAKKKDGSLMWLDSKGKHIPYGNRKIRVSVVYDITQRKLFEENLIKSKKAYEQLVEGSPYGIFIHDEGKVLYANNSAFDIIGISRDSFSKGKFDMYDFMLPEFVEQSYERREKLRKGEDVPFIRIKIKDNKGQVIDVETKSQLISYEGQIAIQSTFKNISAELQLEQEKLRAEIAEQTNKQLAEEISHHKRTQEKLLEVQQFTESIIGSSIDMIMATDHTNLIYEANPAALNTFGYTKTELLGKPPGILYASYDEYLKVQQSLDKTGNFTGEIRNKRKNGELFTSYISASFIRNNSGEITGAMGVSRDISEIIEAEKIVQEQNAKIKSIFENTSNMLIWTMDRDFLITSYNKNFKEIIEKNFGVNINQGTNFMQALKKLISDKIFGPSLNKYELAFKGQPQELEGPLQNIHGQTIWFETFLNPIKPENGEIDEISCVSHDITDKKSALNELRRNEERNKAMINALPDLIFRMNRDGVYLDVVFKRNEGHPSRHPESAPGISVLSQMKAEIGNAFIENIRFAIEKNESSQYEYFIQSGAYGGHYEARFAKINDGEALVIIRDITEKKQAEQDLLNSLKEKEVLLKEVHHRVKNNLQVISSILNLQSSYVKEESTLQILRESQNRIKSMSFIHESLYQNKNFSSVNFSEYIMNLSKNLVHSYQVFSNLVDLKFEVGEVNLNLDQSIPCGLIVNELVSNALKYAFSGDKEGLIVIVLKDEEGTISLRVEDNGKGLPEGFDHNTTETLGLQLVVTLVEQLDGALHLESASGKGTKYLITFDKQN